MTWGRNPVFAAVYAPTSTERHRRQAQGAMKTLLLLRRAAGNPVG